MEMPPRWKQVEAAGTKKNYEKLLVYRDDLPLKLPHRRTKI
jgi:hypothetical protein